MRKLVTIREIKNLTSIPNADFIEKATIDGWDVVVKKGDFSVGDQCLYFEIDSWLPANDSRFAFLAKGGTQKDASGFERIRIKTVKLRNQISQGLALPLQDFDLSSYEHNVDFSDELNVIKYERPEPLMADAAGSFPISIPKTNEERIQNIFDEFSQDYKKETFIPTLKLDGTSCTVISVSDSIADECNTNEDSVVRLNVNGQHTNFIVCSRNLQLKYNKDSHMFKALENSNVFEKLNRLNIKTGYNYAVHGEVLGPGIQNNKEKLTNFKWFVFNLYNIDQQCFEPFDKAINQFEELGIPHVPVINEPFKVFEHIDNITDLLTYADGESLNTNIREGVVFKSINHPDVSFKVISNKFLLKKEK